MSKFESKTDFKVGGAGTGPGGKFDRRREKDGKDGLRVNRDIRAPQIRVIDETGLMIGVMAVPEAVRIAEERGLDLLEIAPTATPPTCKIMDYGKWKYENKKKQVAARKKQTVVTVKEIKMRPRTDHHDFETKMKHGRRFLLDGDKIKVTLRFMGRELAHQELGMDLLKKCIAYVIDIGMVEQNPKMEGKDMYLMLAPDNLKIKEYLKAHPQKAKLESESSETEESDLSFDETEQDSE